MVGDGAVLKDVVAQFDQAARFMMAHFPKEEEFSWTDTSFYSWMRRRHPVGKPRPWAVDRRR